MLIRVNDCVLNSDCVRGFIPKIQNDGLKFMQVHYLGNTPSDVIPYEMGLAFMNLIFPEYKEKEKESIKTYEARNYPVNPIVNIPCSEVINVKE